MPARPHNHEHIHDSQAIEDCRTRRNLTFRSCVEALPEMGEILPECGEVGWKAFGERCYECLLGGLGRTPEQIGLNSRLARTVEGQIDFQGGDEHFISLPVADSRDRVLKWTYGDNFGLWLKMFEIDPDGMNHHVISSGNPDPRYYRIEDNILLGDAAPRNIRIENGTVIPFDAVAEHPSGAARDWCVVKARRGA